MIKYSLILLFAYFLYYAGNIVYDLFLKKGKAVHSEVTEEFSIGDFAHAENPPPSQVGIEDVENINTPKSFHKKELHSFQKQASFEDNPDLEDLRQNFEAEQDMDDFGNHDEIPESQLNQKTSIKTSEEIKPNQNTEKSPIPVHNTNDEKFRQLLNLAETSVQLIANIDGYKIYHSMM